MDRCDPDRLLALRPLARRQRGGGATTRLPGGTVTRRRGRGLEVAELRAFAEGDDPRHIDSKATARTGRPQVRTFHAERDRTLLLVADFRPAMLWGTRRCLRSVAAAEALCLAGWRGVAEGSRVGALAATSDGPSFAPPRSGDRGMVAAVGVLAAAHARAEKSGGTGDPPLSDILETAERLVPRGSEVLLATGLDALGEGFEAAVAALTRRARLRVLRIADAFEGAAPPGRYRFAADGRLGTARIGRGGLDGSLPAVVARLGLDCRTWPAELPPEAQAGHA